MGGVRVLNARLVSVSEGFAASYSGKSGIGQNIEAGLYFGTVLRQDVANGPPLRPGQLMDKQEIIDIWVFDSWLANIDRANEGNLLLSIGISGRFYLIAADQSDCFGGSDGFSDGSWKGRLTSDLPAESVTFLDQVLLEKKVESLRCSVEKVRQVASRLDEAFAIVPSEWWKRSGLRLSEVRNALRDRSRNIETIIDIKKWENLDTAISGGLIFGADSPGSEGADT